MNYYFTITSVIFLWTQVIKFWMSLLCKLPILVFIIASLILKESKSDGSEIAVLMSLLLFDEIASTDLW